MEFTYTALNTQGIKISELLQAEDEDQAVRRLHEQGLTVVALAPHSAKQTQSSKLNARFGRSKIKPDHIVGMTRELAIMIETGVPIVDAFGLLAEHAENPSIRRAMINTLQELNQGRTITQAMSNQPKLFPKLYIAMVASAEVGGTLHSTLNQAADYLEASQEMRRKVKGALTYPTVLVVAMIGVLIFMMVFLIPRFTDLFSHMNVQIPPTMRMMMAVSTFMRKDWWALPFIAGGSFFGMRMLLRSPRGSRQAMKLMLRLPIVGDTIRKLCVARILRALSTLQETGVSLLQALDTITQLAQNVIYEEAIIKMKAMVEGGS